MNVKKLIGMQLDAGGIIVAAVDLGDRVQFTIHHINGPTEVHIVKKA